MKKHLVKIVSFIFCVGLILSLCEMIGCAEVSTMITKDLKTDNLTNPIGIDSTSPYFSWRLEDNAERDQYQTAYRIVVGKDSPQSLDTGDYCWDTGFVNSDESLYIKYEGQPLEASTRYFWRVITKDKDGKTSSSETAFFETGLMNDGWSNAMWIGRGELQTEIFSELTKFTIEFDHAINNEAASLLFGATDSSNYYMWQFSDFSWHAGVRLRPHVCSSGGFSELSSATLENDKSRVGEINHVKIEVDNGVIKTYYNGNLVQTLTRNSFKLGYLGVRRASAESFILDNIVVRDGDGAVVMEYNFDDGNAGGFEKTALKNGRLEFTSAISGNVFIRKDDGTEPKAESAPMLRKEFIVNSHKTVKKATLYATSAGMYEAYINGQRVGDSYFNPGMTAYDSHTMYQTFDVTNVINKGENAIGVYLGHGWFDRALRKFGANLRLYAKLVVEYADGTKDITVTDDSWKFYRYGPILDDDLFNGCKYDGTIEQALEGWNRPGFDDSLWESVAISQPNQLFSNHKEPEIIAQNIPLIRNTEVLPAISVNEIEPGVFIYDFGQNIAGIVRIKIKGERGRTVTLRHAEVLNRDRMSGATGPAGTIFTGNLDRADATDTYVLKGTQEYEIYEPKFTYHGFRYLEITGIDAPLPLEDVNALLIMSDLEMTGSFESSNPLLNRFYLNSLWSAKDNFISVPTDCPQRGERFGWTGDAQIFARTSSYLMDVNAFYQKYCMDMRDTSHNNRIIADVAPASVGPGWYGSGDRKGATNGWGDAIAIIPYEIYKQYGNKQILEENYVTMCNWMDYLLSTSKNFVRDESWTGDWLPVNEAKTPIAVTDTAFCAYTAKIISEISVILGRPEEETAYYDSLYNSYRQAWQSNFLESDGITTKSGTQTSYVLGLKFGLFDEENREAAANKLVKNIIGQNNHLTTGFLGLSYLNPVLTDYGYPGTAYDLMEQTTYPSWLYSVTTGSTSIWESWYALRVYDDGTSVINSNSHNHFSYGAVTEWLMRYVVGMERDDNSIAFKHFLLKPVYGGSLTYAKGNYISPRGEISGDWTLDKETGAFTYDVVIPANTTADLYMPVLDGETQVYEGADLAENAVGVEFIGYENGCKKYLVKSGTYSFRSVVDITRNNTNYVSVRNSSGIDACVTIDGVQYSEFPASKMAGAPITLSGVSNKPMYTLLGFVDDDGNTYVSGDTISGVKTLDILFGYTTQDDGLSGQKTLKISGQEGCEINVNGVTYSLPFTMAFDKGTQIELQAVTVPFAKVFDGFEGIIKSEIPKQVIILNSDFETTLNVKEELYRPGYDLYIDFKNNCNVFSGLNARLTHLPEGYMMFEAVQKSDGSYDPRLRYNFFDGGSVSLGKNIPADLYDKVIVGYIADEIGAESTPVMYIATEAQPNYVNPVRGKSATGPVKVEYADGETIREIVFDVSNWGHWTGKISQLNIDVIDNVSGKLRIAYIKIARRNLKLTVKLSENDEGIVYEYQPGDVVKLSEIPKAENFKGFKEKLSDKTYMTSDFVITSDTVIYMDADRPIAPAIIWDFEDNTKQGWAVQGGIDLGVTDGVLKAKLGTSADMWLYRNGVNAPLDTYKYVVFSMRHNIPSGSFGSKPGELFFRRYGDNWAQHLSKSFTRMPAGDTFETYILDMSTVSYYWNGTLDFLRIDAFETRLAADVEGILEYDYIMLVPATTVTYKYGNGSSSVTNKVPGHVAIDLSAMEKPKREGYVFTGWTDGESIYTESFVPTELDVVLEAVWEKAEPQINTTYTSDGQSISCVTSIANMPSSAKLVVGIYNESRLIGVRLFDGNQSSLSYSAPIDTTDIKVFAFTDIIKLGPICQNEQVVLAG